jgi:hypothetical protein
MTGGARETQQAMNAAMLAGIMFFTQIFFVEL